MCACEDFSSQLFPIAQYHGSIRTGICKTTTSTLWTS